jgi:MFS transporter, DHA1 family, inner membrane transport protein
MSGAADKRRAVARSDWLRIGTLVLAGIVAAMQIGKVPPSLSLLRAELGVGLVASGWILSMFSALGALFGSLAGVFADRFGSRHVTVVSLLVMALASAVGGTAHSAPLLLISRAVEGSGFVVTVVAVPSLLVAAAVGRDRRFVPALWGAYMPVGIAIAMAVSPLILSTLGWRPLWEFNAALLAGLALGVAWSNARASVLEVHSQTVGILRASLLQPGALLLAAMFACYTFQFLSVLGFLPTILQEHGISPRAAGALTALAVLANAFGNLSAGWLFTRGVAPRRLIAAATIAMAAAELIVFSPRFSSSLQYLAAVAFSAIGGLVPASIFTAIPRVAPVEARSTTMGIVVQASHIGQLVGPPAVAAVAAAMGGWPASPWVLVPIAAIGLAAACSLRLEPKVGATMPAR